MYFLVKTYLKNDYSFPGTSDNPMRPICYRHPITGEEIEAHYNDRNLLSDADYLAAGLEQSFAPGKGWCVPLYVGQSELVQARSKVDTMLHQAYAGLDLAKRGFGNAAGTVSADEMQASCEMDIQDLLKWQCCQY